MVVRASTGLNKCYSPGQQLWVDVGELIRDQVADSDGHTLPADTMTGSYELRDLDHATVGQLYEGKLVIDKTYGHASYGCGTCCGMERPTLNPSPFGGPPGIDNEDFIYSTEQCTGFVDDVTYYGYAWSSSNTGVATLPNSTLHTVATGAATGNAAINLQGTTRAPLCPQRTWGPQQPVTVAAPYQVEPIATDSQGIADCPAGSSGWIRNVTNQVQYSNGSAFAFAGLTAADTLSIGSRHDLGGGTATGSATTTGDGSFPDTYSVCSAACPQSTGETDALQSWTLNGSPLPHSNSIVYKCSSISDDGH